MRILSRVGRQSEARRKTVDFREVQSYPAHQNLTRFIFWFFYGTLHFRKEERKMDYTEDRSRYDRVFKHRGKFCLVLGFFLGFSVTTIFFLVCFF